MVHPNVLKASNIDPEQHQGLPLEWVSIESLCSNMDSNQYAISEQTTSEYLNSYKMYASLNWIKKYIKTNIDLSPKELESYSHYTHVK